MTLRWFGSGGAAAWFHCDFIFLPYQMLSGMSHAAIGDPTLWIASRRSRSRSRDRRAHVRPARLSHVAR